MHASGEENLHVALVTLMLLGIMLYVSYNITPGGPMRIVLLFWF